MVQSRMRKPSAKTISPSLRTLRRGTLRFSMSAPQKKHARRMGKSPNAGASPIVPGAQRKAPAHRGGDAGANAEAGGSLM